MKHAALIIALESVPDVSGLRRLYALPEVLSDYEVGEYALQRQRANNAGDVLPPLLRQVVCLSAIRLSEAGVERVSLREAAEDEAQLLGSFFTCCENAPGGLVAWGGEALAVLNARALILGLPASAYWQFQRVGGTSIVDLAALLGSTIDRGALDQCDRLSGGDGCLGLDDAGIRHAWLSGDLASIADACDRAALATARIFLGLGRSAGDLDEARYQSLLQDLHETVIHTEPR